MLRLSRPPFLISLSLSLLIASLAPFDVCFAANRQQQQMKPARLDSTAIFPVQGNVYPAGIYYVTLNIGEPPRPYFFDIDTGSELTWVQCDAPCTSCFKGPHPLYKPKKDKLVPCSDPLCTSISKHPCRSPQEQCDYEIAYADQGSSLGVLIKDSFGLRFVNGSVIQPQLAFGCGYDQHDPHGLSSSPIDGVLGLGSGRSSIISQLQDLQLTRNLIGHCFSSRGGGYLFFGDALVPPSGVTWMPMAPNSNLKYYTTGTANFFYAKQPMNVRDNFVVFDSGSSYTYFASGTYEAFVTSLKKALPGKQLKEAPEDKNLPLCWKGSKKFKSVLDVKKLFKPLQLVFTKSKMAQLEIPPEGYLVVTEIGNACLGILNGTEIGLGDLNVIGDVSMQDVMVVYDNERQQIGWIPADCNRLPNADAGEDGYHGGFTQPYVASMGFLKEDSCASYPNYLNKYQ